LFFRKVSNYKHGKLLSKKRKKLYYGQKIKNYTTFQHLKCKIEKAELNLKGKLIYHLTFELENPYNKSLPLANIKFYGVFQTKKNKLIATVKLKNINNLNKLEPKTSYKVKVEFLIPKKLNPLTTTFRIGLGFYDFPAGFEGNKVKVIY